MKSKKMKMFPFIIMLVAGSITSIMTYYFQYEIKAALLVLLSVLLAFYCMGLLLVNVIVSFDKKNEEEQAKRELEAIEAEQEGLVVEVSELQEEEMSEEIQE